ncbi:hypothetical protein [Desulfonatronospira sp.]|uniref:hypothetical protein n=1 Tax=Desulfonatronospira sp. TaxID=1962951 RepID=UPI0025C0F1CC|nr:hypothetical protein [Desulfonatronospira sp.]
MKKIIFVTFLYLFVLAAPLNSSEFAHPRAAESQMYPQSGEVQEVNELTDNLSFISAGMVNKLMDLLGE